MCDSYLFVLFTDQHILLGANEGVYTLNLNEIHDGTLELIHARRCTWVYVIKDVMMTLSGELDIFNTMVPCGYCAGNSQ